MNEIFKEEKEKLKEILKRKRKEKNEKQRKEMQDLKPLQERVAQFIAKKLEEKSGELNIGENNEPKIEEGHETTKNHSSENLTLTLTSQPKTEVEEFAF